jgi:hypothetical protein
MFYVAAGQQSLRSNLRGAEKMCLVTLDGILLLRTHAIGLLATIEPVVYVVTLRAIQLYLSLNERNTYGYYIRQGYLGS